MSSIKTSKSGFEKYKTSFALNKLSSMCEGLIIISSAEIILKSIGTFIETVEIEFLYNEKNAKNRDSGMLPKDLRCCCCLQRRYLKSLWTEYKWIGQTEVYGEMLKECFNVSWPQEVNSKYRICEFCVTHLRNALIFKRRVMKTRTYLMDIKNVVKKELDTEMDINESITEQEFEVKVEGKPRDSAAAIKNEEQRKLVETARPVNVVPPKSEYLKPRQNVALVIQHSTIVPFKVIKGYFACFYCSKQFVTFDELKSHFNELHENVTFKTILHCINHPHSPLKAEASNMNCKVCNTAMDNLDSLVTHLAEQHSIKFNVWDKKKVNDRFLFFDLSDGKFKCYVCKKEFLFFKTLTNHMNTHSSNFICHICGQSFLLEIRFRFHYKTHLGEKPAKCETCDKVFRSVNSLRSHIRYNHQKMPYKCVICDEKFPKIALKIKHMADVHNRKIDLSCKLCPKKYETPRGLSHHVQVEHCNKPIELKYNCNLCQMRFKSQYELNQHSVVHSGERNYECEFCHKKYSRAKTLTEHLKIHRNDRRWSCRACAQTFVQKCSLKNHIKVHHADMDCESLILYMKPDA